MEKTATLNLRINPTVKQRAEDVLTRLGIEKAVANASDARREWIEAALEEGIKINEPDSLEDYSGQFKLRLPRSLHRLLAEHSKREGISMNQYCVYLLSRNDAVYSKQKRQYDFEKWQHFGNRKSVSQNNGCN